MKRFFTIIAALLLTVSAVSAQDYSTAIGVKGGFTGIGLNYKSFSSPSNFIDITLNADVFAETLQIGANVFYDFNFPIVDCFSFYCGPGVGAAISLGDITGLYATVNVNAGFEYAFATIPLALSIEWAPGIGLALSNAHVGFYKNWIGSAIGLKYTF